MSSKDERMNIIVEAKQYQWLRVYAFNKMLSMSAVIRAALIDYQAKVEKQNG